jgi:shikimate kinase
VLLVGSSGAGKSTLAAALAARLDLPAVDLDSGIARRAGKPIAAIFAEDGEPVFRDLEAQTLGGCLGSPAVVALGGGAWETGSVRQQAFESGFAVLWLAETPERCWARAGGDPSRPLAASRSEFMLRHRTRIARWSGLPCILPLRRTADDLAAALAARLD